MKIVADENIASAVEAFGQFGQVEILPGRAIDRDVLLDAEALIVRSITRVDRTLLAGTSVRFVGTATIGTDHIDLEWLSHEGIATADAAGCNSRSVAEYVIAALFELESRGATDIRRASLGIIGVGRIGSFVSGLARSLGMSVVEHDPPRAKRDPHFRSASIEAALACDVVTVHVPLTVHGEHPTAHLIERHTLSSVRPGGIVINTSRGGVARNADLMAFARERGGIVLDVWECEPDVPPDLIECASIATPHIAGYSAEGKLRGTELMAGALARFVGRENRWAPPRPADAPTIEALAEEVPHDLARRAAREAYDIMLDDCDLRELVRHGEPERRLGFDRLRREYRIRHEFGACAVRGASPAAAAVLRALGFRLVADPVALS